MNYPNFKEEKRLWQKGCLRIAGLDEAGRGPLAGPVVAAAVILKKGTARRLIDIGVRDSKKISPKKRERLYEFLIKDSSIEWGIGRVSAKVIDRINILEATKLAMERAVKNLQRKINGKSLDFLFLDGRMKINLNIPQKSIVKADNKVLSCATASIVAKVSRDRMMRGFDKKYPQYGFSKHKGYATKVHRKMLKKHGPCKIHRKTFRPVREG